jgi:hypothetical protein
MRGNPKKRKKCRNIHNEIQVRIAPSIKTRGYMMSIIATDIKGKNSTIVTSTARLKI